MPFQARSSGREFEQVLALVGHGAFGHFVFFPARQDVRKGALARAVRTHDGVHFTSLHFEVQSFQDLLAFDVGVEVFDLQHWQILDS
jgi:hypothetical protein